MGRHSSPSQWAFYRSVLGWALPWLLVAGLLGVGIWIAVDALGGADTPAPIVAGDDGSPSSSPADRRTEEPRETETPEPKQDEPTPADTEEPKPEVELITENMTVQVLNGTGDPSLDDAMANQLSAAGFQVVSIQGSSREYPSTTVFWSYAESTEAAERLAQRFGWQVSSKPDNLSTEVALHVVVGLDYRP